MSLYSWGAWSGLSESWPGLDGRRALGKFVTLLVDVGHFGPSLLVRLNAKETETGAEPAEC